MKNLLNSLLALLMFVAPATAQSTKPQLNTEVSTNFPDNTTGAITPAILRTTVNDFISSWQQAPRVNAQTGTTYAFVVGDYGYLVTFSNGSPVAVTLPQATSTFATWNAMVCNKGAGAVTITPTTSTIGGSATLVLNQNQCDFIISDGANYQLFGSTAALGIGVGTTSVGGGTTTRVLYDNAGVLGEYPISGSVSVCMSNSCTMTSPSLGTATGTALSMTGGLTSWNATSIPAGGTTGTCTKFSSTSNFGMCFGSGAPTLSAAQGSIYLRSDGASATRVYINNNGTTGWSAIPDTAGGSLTVGTTPVGSGTTTRVLYDNAGVLGEYPASGTSSVCMTNGCTMSNPSLLGSSTGKTTFNSQNASGTDFNIAVPAVNSRLTVTIASGTKALATSAITSATCTAAQTSTATGTLTTDTIIPTFNGDPTGVTGYVPLVSGMLSIIYYPTADTVNFKVCNNTSSSITPGAITLNWTVVR